MNRSLSQPADPAKRLILAAVCLSALVLPLSFSGGAVATPAIGRDLGGDAASLTWITNAFMLSFGSLLMAAGALADQFGRKKLFVFGLGGFIVTSLAMSFAPSVIGLDVLRALQGVAAAASLSSGAASLAQEFDGHARTRAFSLLGTSFGIGLAFGPLMAGVLIGQFGWRSIFAVIAAIGAVAFAFGVPRMRETRDPGATGLDYPGTVTFTATLALFTFGVIEAPERGWGSAPVVALLAASALFLAAFVVVETRAKRPMLELGLFRYPRFVGVQILPVGTCYCYIVLVVMLPLRFIGAEGLSEMDAGLLMIALSAPMLIVPMAVASLTRWLSPGVLSGIGFLIAAAGLFWLSGVDFAASRGALVAPMLVIGVGAGMPWGLMDGLSVSVVPKERAGMASGIFSTTRVAGEGIALAIATAILAALAHAGLARTVAGGTMASDGPGIDARIAEAAQRMTAGDVSHALAALPEVGRAALRASYAEAFTSLLHVLIVITLLSAVATFAFLSRAPAQDDEPGSRADGEARADVAVNA
ncbi:MFS transporter [Paraburkholderia caballeronis]|uniref:MFS transporter n=1 Tax=Paraburkholderia caballeronis TaxID=416943 RepID=UPI001066FA5F|nr:MFS transporter [Paraburkholderia caballeronis]TDV16592.1 MFS transporter [Paraburkholderia caballeronis]TDV18988.1 MFS transporter [Paraburkholderia caballeronis]TDV27121.1 MFS transporter [Paraburkholderia caballeronis]